MKQTVLSVLQLICFTFTPIASSKTEKSNSPFAWSVEKDGKTHYVLGTIHAGVSLEDLPCSNKIRGQIENSDLILLEFTIARLLNHLSKEELRTLFTGSKKEREEVFNKLSPEAQRMVTETFEIHKKTFLDHFIYEGTEDFEDLSEEAKEFLIRHGADIQGDYAYFLFFILITQRNDAVFSFDDSMEFQIARIAQSANIEIEDIEDRLEMLNDLRNSIKNAKKTKHFITRDNIESAVATYDLGVEKTKETIAHLRTLYLSGDDKEPIEQRSVSLEEIILKNRNELWLENFIEAHENPEHESLFLVAGQGHFIGSHSMLDMLKKEGFSVNRMTCPSDTIQN